MIEHPIKGTHQAIESLGQVNTVCLWLEGAQVLGSIAVLTAQYLPNSSHGAATIGTALLPFYLTLLGIVLAVIGHGVSGYVFVVIARNISRIDNTKPTALTAALMHALRKTRVRTLPALLLHLVILFVIIGLRVHGITFLAMAPTPASPTLLAPRILAWVSLALGACAPFLVRAGLRSNAKHLLEYLNMNLGPMTIANAQAPDA